MGWVKGGYGLMGDNQMGFRSGRSITGATPMTMRVQKGAEVLRRRGVEGGGVKLAARFFGSSCGIFKSEWA